MKAFALLAMLGIFTASCSQREPVRNSTSSQSQLKLSDIVAGLNDAKLPIQKLVIFNEDTDPNHLLGRPNGYLEKASWFDARAKEQAESTKCTVEIFANEADAKRRADYVGEIARAAPIFNEYIYLHKTAVLRVPDELTPVQAKEYEAVLGSL
jgi:hypothetical protein